MRIAVLVTAFNRAHITKRGLDSLFAAFSALPATDLEVFLVDDSSPDGTGEEVRALYPAVNVIFGTGDLFWSGGTRLAYLTSLGRGSFDAYLLFNDDVVLHTDRVNELWKAYVALNRESPTAVVGAMTSESGEVTYAGFRMLRSTRALPFVAVGGRGVPEQVDTFNANFVLIPSNLMVHVDGIDSNYRHGLGDLDLGLRILRSGGRIMVHADPVGICEKGPSLDQRVGALDRRARLRAVVDGPMAIRSYLHFVRMHRIRAFFPVYLGIGVLKRIRMVLVGR